LRISKERDSVLDMATENDMAEIVDKADAYLGTLEHTADMSVESVRKFGNVLGRIQCTWVFLEQWLEQHRKLIRYAYRLEHARYWDDHPFRMSPELRILCAEYLQMRKAVRG
jgi:hypothetical protein